MNQFLQDKYFLSLLLVNILAAGQVEGNDQRLSGRCQKSIKSEQWANVVTMVDEDQFYYPIPHHNQFVIIMKRVPRRIHEIKGFPVRTFFSLAALNLKRKIKSVLGNPLNKINFFAQNPPSV